ncbi:MULTISPECIES: AAA family ATPase [Sorangium]|uniref:AAA family ATPase n=1 Tax=Sorangium TaxID=39643 RepID=UPI003D9C1BB8
MILRRLRVQGIRCFRNPVEVDGLSLGTHVVFAPNETGKSTLILALARALFDRYRTEGVEMNSLRPWGTTLSPEMHVEVDVKGKRYLLKKRFLDGARSELLEWNGSRFEPKDEGERADERVRVFLHGESTGRGVTRVDHWGIARVLWLTQRKERTDAPGVGEALRQRLLGLAGMTMLSDKEQQLLDRIEAAYAIFFTSTGKPTKNSPVVKAKEELRAAEEMTRVLSERLQEAVQWTEKIEDNERQLAAAQDALQKYRRDLEEVAKIAQDEERLEQEIRRTKESLAQLQERHDEQQKRLAAVQEDAEEVQRLRDVIAAMEPRIAAAEAEAGVAERALQDAQERERHAATELGRLEQERERARAIDNAAQLRAERGRLRKRASDAAKLAEAISTREQALTARAAPKDEEIRKCEDLQRKIDTGSAKLESLGIEVTFTPDKAREVEWDGLERKSCRLSAKERSVFRGADRGTLVLAGVGTVEIRTGVRDAAELEKQLENWRKELARIFGTYRVDTIDSLRRRRDAVRKDELELASLRESLEERLGEEGDLETLHAGIRKHDGQLAGLAAELQMSSDELAEVEVPDRETIDERWKRARTTRREAERSREESARQSDGLRKQLDKIKAERDGKQREVDTLEAKLQADAVRFGEAKELRKHVATLAAELLLRKSAVTELEARLPPPYARASTRRAGLDSAILQCNDRSKVLQSEVDQCRGKLEQAAGQGLYSQLARAEERVALAREQLEQNERRAAGVETLRKLAAERRDSASRSLVLPIEREVQMRLDYIRGSAGHGSLLAFGAELEAAHIRKDTGEQAPMEMLSWGTQEQVMLCLRLALGSMLATRDAVPEPQLVVLDDPLANTDDGRHARALELIRTAGEHLQIIILTAFPERYRTLGAREYDLVALASRSPASSC